MFMSNFMRRGLGLGIEACALQTPLLSAAAENCLWASRRASSSAEHTSTSGSENSISHSSSVLMSTTASWLQPKAQQANYPAQYAPWTSTRYLRKPRHAKSRMGFLVQALEEEQVQSIQAARPFPDFKVGDVLEVRMVVPEAGRKEYLYRGLCIARNNKGIRSTFKIFNYLPESGGFVQHLPLYMPDLLDIKVVGRIPARRNKLYYIMEHERASSMKFSPPVMSAGAVKPEGQTQSGSSEKKAKGRGKGKKK